MKNLLVFSVFSVIALASTSNLDPVLQECTEEDSMEALTACSPFVTILDQVIVKYKESRPKPEMMSDISVLCDNTTDCIGKLKCKSSKAKSIFFQEVCDGLQFMIYDVLTCLPEFHKAVFDNKYECSKKFDFDSNDMSKRREAYTNGKSCILEIVKKECAPKTLEYFETRYDHFVEIKTNRPEECEGNHHNLEAMKCMHFGHAFNEKKSVLEEGLKINDTKILRVIEICDQALNCDACKLEQGKAEFRQTCNTLKLINSEAGACVGKMTTMKLDEEKYPCLKKDVKCVKSEETIKCTTDAMKEYCGQGAADDFARKLNDILPMIGC